MITAREAFGQYTALYDEYAGRSNAPGLLAELNRAGRAALPKAVEAWRPDPMGLPGTSAPELFEPDYGVNVLRLDMPVDAALSFRCGVPNLNSLLAVVANDAFHPTEQLLRNAPEGLTVCSLRSVPEALALKVSEVLHRGLEAGGCAAALNAMLLADGVLVHVAAGVKVAKAVQIVNISSAGVPTLSPRRVVVIADEGAEVKVLLCDHSQTAVQHLNSEIVDIDVADHAHVELYDIEEGNPSTRRYWQLNARQSSHSQLTVNTAYLHGGVTRNEYRVGVAGDYADTILGGLAICASGQIADNHVTLTHTGTHCTSRQLFKTALFEDAKGGFGGKIIVHPGAVFTDAEQTNRNIVDGTDARMIAAPQLEIYCDEVKCSHGATTGQLDERALFYMQTRGIPADEARRMLTQAFMADVVDNISFEVLRQRLHILVEKRLSGTSASCDTCATACKPDSPCHDDEEL